MRLSTNLGLLGVLSLGSAFTFRPEAAQQTVDSRVPALYNISESQTLYSNSTGTSSYWTSSYVTGHDGRQYLLLSHTLGIAASGKGYYRSSILDLTSMDKYKSYVATGKASNQQASQFNFHVDGYYGFHALSADKVSKIRTYSDHDDVKFDVTLEARSKAFYNGGLGQFMYGTGPTHEWALPSCYTTGSLVIDGKNVTIDPGNSFTWYDRQWGDASPTTGNWTWFQLHFDQTTTTKASVWAIDNASPYRRDRFASLRVGDGGDMKVLPVTYSPVSGSSWTSNQTGIEYPQTWALDFGTDGHLTIQSTVKNQEMAGSTKFNTAYEGFVVAKGQLHGKPVTGWGVVEMVTVV